MKHLYDEVFRRFPEVEAFLFVCDEDLPYVLMGAIIDWLRSVAKPSLPPAVVRRVVEFDRWCRTQPRGDTAADDILTIEAVGLLENLFDHDELLPLIPHLMSRDELVKGRAYFTHWVGADRYEAALQQMKRGRA